MRVVPVVLLLMIAAHGLPAGEADHWAFQPIRRPDVPAVAGADVVHPIDAFLLAKLAESELQMSPAAGPRAFIRRVTLDLTGLPPTPEEVDTFVEECATQWKTQRTLPDAAVKRLINRLLASPRYGERWAQHWLDVIRYADTTGYEKNRVRSTAWPYRDYVIAAFNNDVPWPQFLLEQLAGDTLGMDPATGFLVTAPCPEPKEIGLEPTSLAQARFNSLDEVLQNVGSSVLGLTIGCARCHDHKFDPLTARDYYRMAATFAGLEFDERPWDSGAVPAQRTAPLERRLANVRRQLQEYPSWRETELTRVTEAFRPVRAKWVRFTITAVSNQKFGPAIDELQVWSPADEERPARNVGSAEAGARARSSGADPEFDSRDEHLNDGIHWRDEGRHDQNSLWVAAHRPTETECWIEIELPEPQMIDRVSWCREPAGLAKDFERLSMRSPKAYRIEVAEHPGQWRTVVTEPRSDELPGSDAERRSKLESEFTSLSNRLSQLSRVFAGEFHRPRPMHVLHRGDPQQPRDAIGPGGIDVLGGYELPPDAAEAERRLALARWLGSEEHPLTARVIVNRVWHHHFGTGIVETLGDFGRQGAAPSHPELLDWLASEFMARGWRLKELHRLICTSAAYRQSSRPNPRAAEIDSESRLLWRYPPRRLEAEAIRDSMLFASGSLDLAMGGPGVSIYESRRFGSEWIPQEDPGPGTWRRSIYLLRVRGADDGVFKAFDLPDCGQVRPKRSESTTPLQALNLFNSRFTNTQAQRLADRVAAEVGSDVPAQVERAFALTLSRAPTDGELAACISAAEDAGLGTVCRALFNSNEFLFLE